MDRINGADTVDIGGGRRGFRDEDLPTGQIGTEVTAAWLNMVQEELLKVITEAGLTPSSNDWSQLWTALQNLGLGRSAIGRAWLSITSSTVTAPPASPVKGDIYLVPIGATGVWAGQVGKLAEWTGTEWSFGTTPDGHGISLPDGRVFEKIGGIYTEFLASRSWVLSRTSASTKLNRLPWLPVISMTTTAPPASPAQGDAYLVPTGATGVWAANVGRIAEWVDGAWSYATPTDGHGISLPDGRVFERIGGVYTEFLASRTWVSSRTASTTKLNQLPWLPVISMTTTAPPASPAQGDAYLVPTGASGAWAANAGKIAEWVDGAWSYATPANGHGISLPDGRVFEKIGGTYVEKIAVDVQSGRWNYAVAGGTANVLTATLSPAPVALTAGMPVKIKTVLANTSPVTLNVNGLGAKPVVRPDGRELSPGDVSANSLLALTYDGASFRLAQTPVSKTGAFVIIESILIPADVSAFDWAIPNGFDFLRLSCFMKTPVSSCRLRISRDNGATFLSGSTDYLTGYASFSTVNSYGGSAAYQDSGMAFLEAYDLDTNGFSTLSALFHRGGATLKPQISGQALGALSTIGFRLGQFQGRAVTVGSCNALRIVPLSGTIKAGSLIVIEGMLQ